MNEVITRMTSIEILCAFFNIASKKVGTRLDPLYLQSSERFECSDTNSRCAQGMDVPLGRVFAASCAEKTQGGHRHYRARLRATAARLEIGQALHSSRDARRLAANS